MEKMATRKKKLPKLLVLGSQPFSAALITVAGNKK